MCIKFIYILQYQCHIDWAVIMIYLLLLLLWLLFNYSHYFSYFRRTCYFTGSSFCYSIWSKIVVKFPCKVCNNAVAKNQDAVQSDNCQFWVLIKFNKIYLETYNFLQKKLIHLVPNKMLWRFYSFFNYSESWILSNKGKNTKFKVWTKKNISTNYELIAKTKQCYVRPWIKNSI